MMNAETSLFGNDSKSESKKVLDILKPAFKNLWKIVAEKEKLNSFTDENPKGISKTVKAFLAENGISAKRCFGIREGVEHDFLVAPAIDGEIIIDCKNRKFNSFQSRLKVVKPDDAEYEKYTILKKK